MSALRDLGTICWKELVVISRDRQAAALLFAMPAVFVLFLSLALEPVYGEKVGVRLPVVLEVEDGGECAARLVAGLRAQVGLELVARPPGMDDAALFRSGTARALIRIPEGFTADTRAFLADRDGQRGFGPHRVQWSASPQLDASYRRLLEAVLGLAFMELVQLELVDQLEERGLELVSLGDELEAMGAQLEESGAERQAMGAEMERMGAAMESMGAEMDWMGADMEWMGSEMERMGAALEQMGTDMDELGAEAERLGALLEESGAARRELGETLERMEAELQRMLVEGTRADLLAMRTSALVEARARAEAARAREQLAQDESGLDAERVRGSLPVVVEWHDGVALPTGGPSAAEHTARPAARPVRPPPYVPAPRPERTAPREPEQPGASEAPAAVPVSARPAPRLRPEQPAAEQGAKVARSGGDEPFPFLLEASREGDLLPTPLQQTVPGWALFAMFFIVIPLSQSLHRERSEGTLRRMLALGVPKGAIVAGKLLPFVLIGALQFAGMLVVGLLVVPLFSDLALDLGARPLVLVPITLASALAAASYGLLVASVARTAEQAAAFGATSVVVLSLLGGVMVPHFVMPNFLREIGHVSPIYWAHGAYLDAFLHGAGLAQVAPSLAVLAGFALVCLVVSVQRITRSGARS